MVRRVVAVLSLAAIAVAASATPAFAHAVLLTTTPAPGQVLTTAPKAVSLTFSENVEASLGALRLFDARGRRLDAGAPEKPSPDTVQVPLRTSLREGSYVVTWRVISADSHPVQGSFTFQVGTAANATSPRVRGLADRLLHEQQSSTLVAVLYGIARGAVFGGLALLIGALAFCVLIWPAARRHRGSRRLVWIGWWTTLGATVASLLLEGPYGAALPLSKAVDPDVVRDVLDTRFGHFVAARIVLLVLAVPLLRVAFPRGREERFLPRWWRPAAAAGAVALAFTPALAGHASSGDLTGLAVPLDVVHILAMAVWLGGLGVLALVLFRRADVTELRAAVPRFSRWAFASVALLVVTGGFQTWRQVRGLDAFRNTDYGQILLVKLFVFALLVVVAARSRQIVSYLSRPVPIDEARIPVVTGGADDRTDVETEPDEPLTDEEWAAEERFELRRLRGSVIVELLLAIGIIAATSLLVNAVPAKIAESSFSGGATGVTLKSSSVWVDVTAAPGKSGRNDVHVSAIRPDGTPTDLTDLTLTFGIPGRGIAPIDVPLRHLGPGHYLSPGFDVPIKGTWQVRAKATVSAFQEVTLTGTVTIG